MRLYAKLGAAEEGYIERGPNFRVPLQVHAGGARTGFGQNKRDRRGINEVSPMLHVPRYQTDPSWLDLALKLGFRTRMPVCRHALSVFSKSTVTFRRGKWRDDGQVRLFHNTLFVDCRRPGRCGRSRRQ
jgi:hypothetical protein